MLLSSLVFVTDCTHSDQSQQLSVIFDIDSTYTHVIVLSVTSLPYLVSIID